MIEDKIEKYLSEYKDPYAPGVKSQLLTIQLKRLLGDIETAIDSILKYYKRPDPDHKLVLRDLQKVQKMVKKAKTAK